MSSMALLCTGRSTGRGSEKHVFKYIILSIDEQDYISLAGN